jgi:hypothetical protein
MSLNRKAIAKKKAEWDDRREILLSHLTPILARSLPNLWIPSKAILNEETLPEGTDIPQCLRALWLKRPDYTVAGTLLYYIENGRNASYILLRHKKGNGWILQGRTRPIDFHDIDKLVVEWQTTSRNDVNPKDLACARQKLAHDVKLLIRPESVPVSVSRSSAIVTPAATTTSCAVIKALQQAPDPMAHFKGLSPSRQATTLKRLITIATEASAAPNTTLSANTPLVDAFLRIFSQQTAGDREKNP